MLRSRDEGEGSEAAAVFRLTRADWLLENARARTLAAGRPIAEAVAVAGGRVLAVGSRAALRPLVGPPTARVVTNPAFVHWRGDVYRHETLPSARSWLYRAGTLAAAGVPLAAASDAPVVPPSPWVGMAAARTRRTRAGHALAPAERLDAAAALRLYTTGAAFALGAEPLGRLVPGGPADLVVVEPDPVLAGADEVAASRVVLTLVAGRQAWPA